MEDIEPIGRPSRRDGPIRLPARFFSEFSREIYEKEVVQ